MSILENILLGAKDQNISMTEVIEICKCVNIYEDIISMPDKFQTIITSKSLSFGQQKKIQLARCIARDTQIILLDEPFSNLDTHSKTKFLEVIDKYFSSKTVIIATHDESVIKSMTTIFLI